MKFENLYDLVFCRPVDGQNTVEASQQQFDAGHVQLTQHTQPSNNPADGTFRQPLPPGIVRPRMPLQPNILIRNPIGKEIVIF